MHLHVTINGRWVDAVRISEQQRNDKPFLEALKQGVRKQWQGFLKESRAVCEFYLDPFLPEATNEPA